MDELLMARVKQLKEIEERLERIESRDDMVRAIRSLRADVLQMVADAEREYAEF